VALRHPTWEQLLGAGLAAGLQGPTGCFGIERIAGGFALSRSRAEARQASSFKVRRWPAASLMVETFPPPEAVAPQWGGGCELDERRGK
jgi:hypothetical protein